MTLEDCSPAHFVAESPRAARRWVREVLEQFGCHELVDDAELLVSEVVTNAVLHGGISQAPVTVTPIVGGVRIDVVDPADAFPAEPVVSALDTPGGLGLGIVDTLARSWGVEPTYRGKVVWFELVRPTE